MRIWVVDTSEIINVRRTYQVANAEDAGAGTMQSIFDGMLKLTEGGQLALPRQVVAECGNGQDEAAEFVRKAYGCMLHPDPDFHSVREVMAVAGDLVDLKVERDDADPWVLAMALELQARGHDVTVVTADFRDGRKTSMATAASRLSLRTCRLFVFLRECNLEPA